MLNYKIVFKKKTDAEDMSDADAFNMIEDYWNSLNNNGQVIGGYDIFANNDNIYLTTVLPTSDSLSEIYCNKYVKERYEKISRFFDAELLEEGENLEYKESCSCQKPSWYFLCNERNSAESPLVCGDCKMPVPLYNIPYIFNEEEHFSVLNWQRAKNAIDKLWWYGLWDKFTNKETFYYKSKLNREGRKICKALEKVLGLPVYFYLYYVYDPYDDMAVPNLPHDIAKACPQCGGGWTDDSEFCKCEKCRLIVDSPEWKKETLDAAQSM